MGQIQVVGVGAAWIAGSGGLGPCSATADDAADDPASLLEDFADDPTRAELVSFINGLNVVWIGRGTFGAEECDEAVETARNERVNATSRYLVGMPLLADYLEEGIEKLGISAQDAESDVL